MVAGLVCRPVWTIDPRRRVCDIAVARPGVDPEHSAATSTPQPAGELGDEAAEVIGGRVDHGPDVHRRGPARRGWGWARR